MGACNVMGGNHRERGFTIIETMLAFIVLLIAIMGLVVTGAVGVGELNRSAGIANIPESFGFTKTNSDDVQAQTAAQQYMDALRSCVQTTGTRWNSCASAPTIAIDPGYMYFANGATAVSEGNFSFSSPGGTASGCTQGTGLNTALFTCTVYVTWTEPGVNNQKSFQITSMFDDQR